MIVGSIKENITLEKRVSVTPESAKNIIGLGLKLCIEKGYGIHLGISDDEYKNIGADIKNSSSDVINSIMCEKNTRIPNLDVHIKPIEIIKSMIKIDLETPTKLVV